MHLDDDRRFREAVRLNDLASFLFLRGYYRSAAMLKEREADYACDERSRAYLLQVASEWHWIDLTERLRKKSTVTVH